jgi:hypothetical protein
MAAHLAIGRASQLMHRLVSPETEVSRMGRTEARAARATGVRFISQDDLVVDLTDGCQFLLWLA